MTNPEPEPDPPGHPDPEEEPEPTQPKSGLLGGPTVPQPSE